MDPLRIRTCIEAMEFIVNEPSVVSIDVRFPLLTKSQRDWIELQLQDAGWWEKLKKEKN